MSRGRGLIFVAVGLFLLGLGWWLGPGSAPGAVELYLSAAERSSLGLPAVSAPPRSLAGLDPKALQEGCPVIDCISSIDGPAFEAVAQADRWLRDDDLVLGVSLPGMVKAYPLRILNWHELVNDFFGETPVVISYCPLCNTGLAFRRPALNGAPLKFGVSGRLYRSDLVMFDRATGTFWSQVEGRALLGPLAGTELERLPADLVPWGAWKSEYPRSEVLARPTFATPLAGHPGGASSPPAGLTRTRGRFFHDYSEDPYRAYRADAGNTFGAPFDDGRLPAKAEVIGLAWGGAARAFPVGAFGGTGERNSLVGETPVVLVWRDGRVRAFGRAPAGQTLSFSREGDWLVDEPTGTRWGLDGTASAGPLRGQKLEEIPTLRAYWFAWLAFHPRTTLDQDP